MYFLAHAVFHAEEHSAAAGEYYVFEEVFFDVSVALENCIICPSLDGLDLLANEVGLEEHIGGADELLLEF